MNLIEKLGIVLFEFGAALRRPFTKIRYGIFPRIYWENKSFSDKCVFCLAALPFLIGSPFLWASEKL